MEDRGKHVETLLVIFAGLTILFILNGNEYLLYTGLGLAIIGLAIPILGKYIYLIWMGIGKALGFVNSHIILGALFFVILTPLALIRKLGRKDKLRIIKRSTASYFDCERQTYSPKDLENPW